MKMWLFRLYIVVFLFFSLTSGSLQIPAAAPPGAVRTLMSDIYKWMKNSMFGVIPPLPPLFWECSADIGETVFGIPRETPDPPKEEPSLILEISGWIENILGIVPEPVPVPVPPCTALLNLLQENISRNLESYHLGPNNTIWTRLLVFLLYWTVILVLAAIVIRPISTIIEYILGHEEIPDLEGTYEIEDPRGNRWIIEVRRLT